MRFWIGKKKWKTRVNEDHSKNQCIDGPSIYQQLASTIKKQKTTQNKLKLKNNKEESYQFKDCLRQYINQHIEINTFAGFVVGVVTKVSDQYLELHESEKMIVLIQLEHMISFQNSMLGELINMKEKLHSLVGSNIQVATALETTSGKLVSIDDTKLTLRTLSSENEQHMIFQLKSISYVRVIS